MDTYQIEGRNTVIQALKSGRNIDRLYVMSGGDSRLSYIVGLAREKKVVITEVSRGKLDEISRTDGAHQGAIAVCAAVDYVSLDDILQKAEELNEKPLIIIADGITDPHNMGAIIRSAAACGAHGIIIPKRRSVGINETVEKASAGTAGLVGIAKVVNLASAIDYLKQRGVWITGTALDEKSRVHYEADYKGSTAIVIGSEGQGMSRLVQDKCDFLVKIPINPAVQSLNASVAAGIILSEAVRQRGSFCG